LRKYDDASNAPFAATTAVSISIATDQESLHELTHTKSDENPQIAQIFLCVFAPLR
jgi:hypothetical protein